MCSIAVVSKNQAKFTKALSMHTPSRQQHIRVHARIRLRNLMSAPQYNGCRGVVASFDSSKQRYGVQLDNGKELSLKPACVLQMAEVELGNAGFDMQIDWGQTCG